MKCHCTILRFVLTLLLHCRSIIVCLVIFFVTIFLVGSKHYLVRSKKPNDYSPLAENLSKRKRKRDGRIVVGEEKSLRLKYKKVILEKIVSREEDEKNEEKKSAIDEEKRGEEGG